MAAETSARDGPIGLPEVYPARAAASLRTISARRTQSRTQIGIQRDCRTLPAAGRSRGRGTSEGRMTKNTQGRPKPARTRGMR
jgi:hypothetical protein